MTPTAASARGRRDCCAGSIRVQAAPPTLQAAGEMARVPPLDVLLDAIHVRDEHGRWSVGGAAWTRIGQEVTVLRPLAFLAALPVIRTFVEWTFALVAGNRHRLSRVLGDDACQVEPRTP